jgi:hypothetical protein
MRLQSALIAALIGIATSLVAIASVFAQGDAVVAVAGSADEPAVEWDIDVAGGTPSTDHITLAPTAVGIRGEFTVAVAGSGATVTLTTLLPAERELVSVGCLDDLSPPTEINPAVDRLSFTLDVVPGHRYACFAASLPSDLRDPASAPAQAAQAPTATAQAPTDRPLPRSDTSTSFPSVPLPGWLTVVGALVAIVGVAVVLRPARR